MTKVVINATYGGFSLSDDATRALLRRRGVQWEERPSKYQTLGVEFYVDGEFYTSRNTPRTDPDLVAVVEEMGNAANGRCAALEIVDLEPGTHYIIDEYDGLESIQTRDGIGWSVA